MTHPVTGATLCVLPHTDVDPDTGQRLPRERPTLAADGTYLCPGHEARLHANLTGLLELAVDLHAQLAGSSSGGPKVSGTPGRTFPGDLDAAEHLRIITVELVGWCRVVADERHVALPDGNHLATLVRYLTRHALWVAAQPWVDAYDRQLRDLHADGRRILSAGLSRRIDLGPCDHPVACDVDTHLEQTCPGVLRAVVRRDQDTLPPVVCTSCGLEHPSSTWRALGRRLRAGADAWLTGAQLSEALRVPWGTVRRWAVEDGWRHLDGRPRRYHADDAQATFDARRATPTSLDVKEARSA